ncbi:hypothetical protein D9758_005150 [Tetrapyrgos nigripes]|uniref:Uncharacterized protein n=1 Tax=Tetrapyrgos nigripes TaxID=182062 RepID=A0A8H5GWX1_9AGAR|nr:hypothetical protein D9758_005150 [Tetrapyrgos nigripes]
MLVGGYVITEEQAKALTGFKGDDLESVTKRDFVMGDLVKQEGGAMEIVSHPRFNCEEDICFLIPTRYREFSIDQFRALNKDQSKLSQLTPYRPRDERVAAVLKGFGLQTKYITCFVLDRLVNGDAFFGPNAIRIEHYNSPISPQPQAVSDVVSSDHHE